MTVSRTKERTNNKIQISKENPEPCAIVIEILFPLRFSDIFVEYSDTIFFINVTNSFFDSINK